MQFRGLILRDRRFFNLAAVEKAQWDEKASDVLYVYLSSGEYVRIGGEDARLVWAVLRTQFEVVEVK